MPADNGSLTLIATHPAMPEIVFKGKEYVYNHHLTVPYRPLAVDTAKGIGPGDLRFAELMSRLSSGEVTEVIIATDPNLEGEATAAYLGRLLKDLELRVTRLASGLPVGGDLEYADEVTLGRAFEGRTLIHA